MIRNSATPANNASAAAIMAIGQHIDPRNKIDTLIAAESFLMGMMMLIAPDDLRSQGVFLDALTERVMERLAGASK